MQISRRMVAVLCLWALPHAVGAAEADSGSGPRVSLQAAAEREVAQDVMYAVLSVQADDNNLGRLQDTIKQKADWALKLPQESPYIQAETLDFRVYPVYDRYDPYRFSHWWATQDIRLRSSDFAALNRVLGNLQGRVLVKSVTFGLSAQARREAENRLLEEALAAFRTRAELMQKGLNAAGYRIVLLEVHITPAARPDPQSPGLAAASEQVGVTLLGSIELQ